MGERPLVKGQHGVLVSLSCWPGTPFPCGRAVWFDRLAQKQEVFAGGEARLRERLLVDGPESRGYDR